MRIKLVSLLLIVLLWALAAQAATRYASSAGGGSAPCTTQGTPCALATAISQMVSGDTLILQDGTYAQVMRLTSNVAGGGEGSRSIIRVADGATVRLLGIDIASNGASQYVTITGEHGTLIVDSQFTRDPNIENSHNVHHMTFKRIEITNSLGQGILIGNNPDGINNLQFLDLHVHQNGIRPNGQNTCGGFLADGDQGECHGIYIGDRGAFDLIFDGGSYHHNEGSGIHAYGLGPITIRNVTAHDSYFGNGLWPIEGSNALVYNNVSYANHNFGLWAGATGLYANNTLVGNGLTGVNITGNNGVYRNNLVYNNPDGPFGIGATGLTFSNNLCNSLDTGCSLTGNPLFANAPGGDYHLGSGSAAIDVGTDLSATFTTDKDGNTRQMPWDVGAYDATGQAQCVCTTGSEPCCPPPNPVGLVGWWKFDGDFTDSSGHAHPLTGIGGVTAAAPPIVDSDPVTAGAQGNAVLFDGVNDQLTVSHADFRPTTSVGLSAWIKISTNTDPICRIISAANAPVSPYILGIRRDDGLPFCDANGTAVVGPTSLLDGTAHHLACGRDGANLRLWQDNANVATTPIVGDMSYAGTETLAIGGVSGRFCQATIDQVRVYANQDMVAQDVANLFAEGAAIPLASFSITHAVWTQAHVAEGALRSAVDAHLNNPLSTPFGYRVALHYSGAAPTPSTEYFPLYCRRNAGAFTAVTTAFGSLGLRVLTDTAVNMGQATSSTLLPDDGLVTMAGVFTADSVTPASGRIAMTNGKHAELEYRLETGAPAIATDTFQCRPHREAGTDFGTSNYVTQPTLTVLADPTPATPAAATGVRIIGGAHE